MDIATVSTLLGSIKTATEIAKLIKDSGVSLEQAEVKFKVAELISALADAKIEVAGIQCKGTRSVGSLREADGCAVCKAIPQEQQERSGGC